MTKTRTLRGSIYWSTIGSFFAAHFFGLNYLITGKIVEWDIEIYIGSGAYFLFVLAAVHLIPASMKHVLIFWRFSNPLPGCRAFSEIAQEDPRINLEILKQRLGKLPKKPQAQNALWYQLYRKLATTPTIFTQHCHFLTLRDASALLVLLLVTVPVAVCILRDSRQALIAAVVEFFLFLFFATAARNAGKRFAASVLSEYCSSKQD